MKQATARRTALDTNVLARYYVQAEQSDAVTVAQCEQARALLESGKPLFVATTVALELECVLRGFYKLKPKTVADVFTQRICWSCPMCKCKTAKPCKALVMP
jgi:predicted nucleic-acid-binding protein